ncbi:MAG TPA: periplasmic heavy metal sensor, partial [Paracoccaceae bacterium]|nr:periplasmic heavy metal sensor [Paracoccaceae bacterium]
MIKPLLLTPLTALALGVPQVNAQTAAPAESRASDAETDRFYGAMQERYRLMQEQIQRIRQTKDPKERQRLMREHWQTVHEGAGMMGGGWDMGYGMMGGYGMGPGMGGYGMGHGMMGGGWGMGPEGLSDLTAEQRTQIAKIRDETRKKHWDLMGKMMDEQARLRDLYDAPKRDSDAIANAHKKVSELQRRIYEDAADAHKRMESVLTKEQQEKSWRFWRNW